MFDRSSRYHPLPTASYVEPDGREIVYVRRRILPPGSSQVPIGEVQADDADRLDHFAHRAFGDPTLFWRLADANDALHPAELTARAGRRLQVPNPGI